jgi:hypothetical protein
MKALTCFIGVRVGVAHQLVSECVADIVKRFLIFMSSISQIYAKLSVQDLQSALNSDEATNVRLCAIICQTVGDTYGGVLYNTLTLISQQGDPQLMAIANEMKLKAFQFIDQSIRDWVSKGQINCRFPEFFIKCNQDVTECSKWWKDRYSIVPQEVPKPMTQQQIYTIFSTGKAVSFLNHWDKPMILDIDSNSNLDDFIEDASKEAHSKMLEFLRGENLAKSVKDIHDFVLLQRGDFSLALTELDQKTIGKRLQSIFQRFFGRVVQEVDFEIRQTESLFSYRAIPPISALFGENELNAYRNISGILLKMKRAEFLLVTAQRSSPNRWTSILIFEMLEFVRLIQEFLNIQIIRKSYQTFAKVVDEGKTFDEILKGQRTHISFIAKGCWATEHGGECRKRLMVILIEIEAVCSAEFVEMASKERFYKAMKRFHRALMKYDVNSRELGKRMIRAFEAVLGPLR